MSESIVTAIAWMVSTGFIVAGANFLHDFYSQDSPPPRRWLVHGVALNFSFGFFLEAAWVVFDESQKYQTFYRSPDVAGIFVAIAAVMLGLQRLHEKDKPTT